MKRIFALAATLLCAFALTGCSGPTPTETVTQFLEGLKTGDMEAIATTYAKDSYEILGSEKSDESLTEVNEAVGEELLAKLQEFDYTVSNEVIDGDKASVDVTITTYALGGAFNSFMTDYLSQALTLAFSGASDEELEKIGEGILSDKIMNMQKTYTETVTINLTKTDGTWTIDKMDEKSDFHNAITGGAVKAIESIENM